MPVCNFFDPLKARASLVVLTGAVVSWSLEEMGLLCWWVGQVAAGKAGKRCFHEVRGGGGGGGDWGLGRYVIWSEKALSFKKPLAQHDCQKQTRCHVKHYHHH